MKTLGIIGTGVLVALCIGAGFWWYTQTSVSEVSQSLTERYEGRVDRVFVVLEHDDEMFRLTTNSLVRTGQVTTYRTTVDGMSGTKLTFVFPSGETQSYMQPDAESNRLYLLTADEEIVRGSVLVRTSD